MNIADADIDTRYAVQHLCRRVERAVESLTLTGNTSPALIADAQAVLDELTALLGSSTSSGVPLGEYPQWDTDLVAEIGVAEIMEHPDPEHGVIIRNKSLT